MSSAPLKYQCASLAGAQFLDVNLEAARFEDVNLRSASFENVALVGATFKDINFSHASIGDSCLEGMKINGILVTELLDLYDKRSPRT